MAASTFGECTCGFAKAAHSAAALRGGAPTGRRSSVVPVAVASPPSGGGGGGGSGACTTYKINLSAASFGECVCGFPKRHHADGGAPPRRGAAGKVAALAGKMAAGMRFAPMTLLPASPPAISAADDGDAGPAARAARMRKASLRAAGLGSELSSMVMVHGGSQKEPATHAGGVRPLGVAVAPHHRRRRRGGAGAGDAGGEQHAGGASGVDGGGEALTGLSLAVVSRARRTARPPTRKRG